MKNIWHIFIDDLRSMTSNTVTIIIALGLVFLPSIFSWYNILSCWDLFDNTGDLKVAVANTDEGYQSDLVPIKINIGSNVVSALRANDQLDWVVTTEEDAIDGTKSGEYYAAVVIPDSFSEDMLSFYMDDAEHAEIIYYTNEKKNAVAPKITGQGADRVAYLVNETFVETLSEISLSLIQSFNSYLTDNDANKYVAALASTTQLASSQLDQAALVFDAYGSMMGSAQRLVDGSSELLAQSSKASSDAFESVAVSGDNITKIQETLDASSEAVGTALEQSQEGIDSLRTAINNAFDSSGQNAADTAAKLRDIAVEVKKHVDLFQDISDTIHALIDTAPEEIKPRLEIFAQTIDTTLEHYQKLYDTLIKTADDLDSGASNLTEAKASVNSLLDNIDTGLSSASVQYNQTIKPDLEALNNSLVNLVSAFSSQASDLSDSADSMSSSASSLSGDLSTSSEQMKVAARAMRESSDKLTSISNDIMTALAKGSPEELKSILSGNSEEMAKVLAAPVVLNRQAIFPAENFGSQMAPLYTMLALWIGSLLLCVAIKPELSEKQKARYTNLKLHQQFFGRFGVFAVMSLLQTTIMALGHMYFLEVQVDEPLLFFICFWSAGIVFTFFIYSMVVSFANLGKAIAVLMLIMQVSSGGGSYPLQTLPYYFEVISPLLPGTHVVNSMRAAMYGVYMNDFWIQTFELCLFMIPALILGCALRKPLISFVHWYVEKVESSKLVK